jgi:hypothetical protein
LAGVGVKEVLNEEGHGLDVDTTLLQAGEIYATGGEPVPNVEPFIEDAVRQVVMAIPHQGRVVKGVGPLGLVSGPALVTTAREQ